MSASRYPKQSESLGKTRIGASVFKPTMVEEVIRDDQ